jgi:putative oxygen-independent coproporphyrinogen III oxidase
MSFLELPPLSLYIHTPWCVKKCPYCDFNSQTWNGVLPEARYEQALYKELNEKYHLIINRPIQSIFIGGGTPSLLSPAFYARLFEQIKKITRLTESVEITLEANPGTTDQALFQGYREIGINRLSLGVQSFQDDQLKKLGRIHDTGQARNAVSAAKKAGFDNINIDLMFGLPGQKQQDALFDIKTALSLEPQHLSWYQLTIEPDTHFYKRPPLLPPDDHIWEMQEAGPQLLRDYGFQPYEISAYAQSDRYCRHNLNYWEFGDYLGIGAGAHSKITQLNEQRLVRLWNIKNARLYMDANLNNRSEQRILTTEELPLEFMMNALRLHSTSFIQYEKRTGLGRSTLTPMLASAQQNQWLTSDSDHIRLTNLGKRFLNDVLELFLP